ncbi:MAG: ABC transporter permease [Cellulomonadaceae bacterium]|nr:ABC transporter permease [Cellulomonadaceae bacterium]
MVRLLIRRIASGIVLVFVIASLTFVMMRFTGTDPARAVAGQQATAEQVAQKAHELGLDRPLLTQYVDWLAHVARGDFGASWFGGTAVTTVITNTLPVTLSIVLAGLLAAAVVSTIVGVAAAVRGGWFDTMVQTVAVVGAAVPNFVVALVLAIFVAVRWGWLPATGFVPFAESPSQWLAHIILPAIALAVGATAGMAQQVRGSMLDVLQRDYIRTLRSRGVGRPSLLFRHALRNAAPPALTVLALLFIGLMGGAVIIEKVFGLAGMGSAATQAASTGDQPVVLGVVVVTVVIVVVVNVLMDLSYGLLNPKVRVQ